MTPVPMPVPAGVVNRYDTSDVWFPSNSSRLIVDDGLAAIRRAGDASKPFYLNLHFHISHAPMYPTKAQYQALADWEAPPSGDGCAETLRSACPWPFTGGVVDCLACTRAHAEGDCNPKQRNVYCDTNGTGVPTHTDPASHAAAR